MNQASIEEAHDAFKDEIMATLQESQRLVKELRGRGKLARAAAEALAATSVLLYKCLRLIKTLVDENKKLRRESIETKRINNELTRTRFHPVAKAHLN